jgi:hypothetical protein
VLKDSTPTGAVPARGAGTGKYNTADYSGVAVDWAVMGGKDRERSKDIKWN